MKKFISLLMITTFLLAALTACSANAPETVDTDAPKESVDETPKKPIIPDDETPLPNPGENKDYGKLTLVLPNVIYSNYPAVKIDCIFSKPEMEETLTFSCSDASVTVENGMISAKGIFANAKSVTVTAKSEHFEASDTVRVMNYQGGLSLESKLVNRQNQIATRSGGDTENCVLFVGDSFFNPDNWWTNFYNEYSGKKAYTVGISSTTTEDWQIMSERLVYPYSPKAVVIHCGTNDIFDDGNGADQVAERLKTLFETYHERMPETKVYWFSIEPRVGKSFTSPKAVNDAIKSYATDKDWLVYIDSASWCFEADGTTVKSSFFKDGIHPQDASYELYRNALTSAGLTFENTDANSQTKIADIIRDKSQNIGAGASAIVYRGGEIKTEYVISGTMTLTDIANNGHAEFQFNTYKNRFLIWDRDNDKKLGVGWALEGSSTVNEEGHEEFTLGSEPLVIEWKLLFTDKNAYLYLDGELKAVYYNVKSPTHLVISSENMTVTYTNITVYTKAADADQYNKALAEVTEYESQTGTETRVIRVTE